MKTIATITARIEELEYCIAQYSSIPNLNLLPVLDRISSLKMELAEYEDAWKIYIRLRQSLWSNTKNKYFPEEERVKLVETILEIGSKYNF